MAKNYLFGEFYKVRFGRKINPGVFQNARFTNPTLGRYIVFDGKVWRDPTTGAAVAHLLTCFPGWTWEYLDTNMTTPA